MNINRKILLLVEARQADANTILRMLRETDHYCSFMIEIVETLADGIRHANAVDVAVLDLSLPDVNGLAAFLALRDASNIPIIVLAVEDDENLGLEAVKNGAQDFLVFGQFSAQTLHRSIMYAIERHWRELAESRLGSVLTAIVEMRHEVSGLTREVRKCRRAVCDLSDHANLTAGANANNSG